MDVNVRFGASSILCENVHVERVNYLNVKTTELSKISCIRVFRCLILQIIQPNEFLTNGATSLPNFYRSTVMFT